MFSVLLGTQPVIQRKLEEKSQAGLSKDFDTFLMLYVLENALRQHWQVCIDIFQTKITTTSKLTLEGNFLKLAHSISW